MNNTNQLPQATFSEARQVCAIAVYFETRTGSDSVLGERVCLFGKGFPYLPKWDLTLFLALNMLLQPRPLMQMYNTINTFLFFFHMQLQKIVKNGVISYEAGCSNTCSSSTKSCATITTGDCFQECCNATNAACCMKLDGQVHFNTAPLVRKGSILKIFTCAFFVIFISRFLSSTQASI